MINNQIYNQFNFEEHNKDINNIPFYDNHSNLFDQRYDEYQDSYSLSYEKYTKYENDIDDDKNDIPINEENNIQSPIISLDEVFNPSKTDGNDPFIPFPIFHGIPSLKNEKETSINSNSYEQDKPKDNNNKTISKKGPNKSNKYKHTKYSNDNMRRKINNIILNRLLDFINEKIRKLYNNKIGLGICEKKFKKLNQKLKKDTSKEFIKILLNTTLEKIFSDTTASYPNDFNKNLTKNLMNKSDISKRNYFQSFFRLTFLNCLRHFRGDEYHIELDGMSTMNNEIQAYSSDPEYMDYLEYYFKNFENILYDKKSNKIKKKRQNNNTIVNSNFNSIINY